jgi:iron complex outermembrane receptor protein
MSGKKILPVVVSAVVFGGAVQAEHLEEVIVTASRETRTIEVAEAMVISPDAAQLLKKAPGANVNSNGPLTGIPQYRGMFGPRIGVQLDGTQLAPAGPNWMDPPLSYAAAAQLESLEIYRGIAPVSVVQESIGGAINAVTAQKDFGDSADFDVNGILIASGQTVNDGSQAGVTLFAVNNHHRLRLAAMTEQGDDAEFPDGDIVPTEYERDRYDFTYGFQTGAHVLDLSYTRNETGDTGTPALPMDIQLINGDLYSLAYGYRAGDWRLKAKVFGSQLDHKMTNYDLRTAPADAGLWRRNTTDSKNVGFKLTASRQDDQGSWLFGADGLDATHNSDIDNPENPMFFVVNFNDAERQILGLFAERQHDFGNAWTAELGLRYNRVEMDADIVDGSPVIMPPARTLRDNFNNADRNKTDDNIDAVAKAWYEASEQVTYYLGVGRKTRSPSYQERYLWLPLQATGGLADGYTYTGNIELDPEVAYEIESGLDFSRGGFSLSPRLYYREVDDYMQGTPSSVMPALMFVDMMNMNNGTQNPAPLQFNNVDAKFWGFDMDWRANLDANWSLRGLLNYVRGERDDIDDDLYRIAPLNTTLALEYTSDHWGASVEGVYYDEQDKVSSTNGELPSDDYALLNVNAWWRPLADLRLIAGIDNLLDEEYEDHLSGTNRVMGNTDLPRGARIPGYGINGFLRVDYSF